MATPVVKCHLCDRTIAEVAWELFVQGQAKKTVLDKDPTCRVLASGEVACKECAEVSDVVFALAKEDDPNVVS